MRKALAASLFSVAAMFFAAWLGRVGQRNDQHWLEIVGAIIVVLCIGLMLMGAYWLTKGIFRLLTAHRD